MEAGYIPKTIEEYIAAQPVNVQEKLREMLKAVMEAAPQAIEKISYRMPAFTFNGMLLYFAAHTNHIGFYPFTTAIKAFSRELSPYHTSKGGIQFPYKSPLPVDLIKRMVEFRVRENLEKAASKQIAKPIKTSKT